MSSNKHPDKPGILVVSCTNQTNLELSARLFEILKAHEGHNSRLIKLEDYKLPLYTSACEEAEGIPEAAYSLSEIFQSHQAFIMVAPEYNGSIPPILSNAVAWVSRTGKDWRFSFNGKFMVMASQSGGGGQKVVDAMAAQFEHLGAIILPRKIIVNAGRPYAPESAKLIIDQLALLTSSLYR